MDKKCIKNNSVAVIGSGPAGLMATTILSEMGLDVTLYEKQPGLGRKLLIAGSSGLNISNNMDVDRFVCEVKSDATFDQLVEPLRHFYSNEWIGFLENKLSKKCFLGTSGRYFIEEMNAAQLLNDWTKYLLKNNVKIYNNTAWLDLNLIENSSEIELTFKEKNKLIKKNFNAVLFALGGASWLQEPLTWDNTFKKWGLKVINFSPSNVGYHVDQWNEKLANEVEGLSIKDCILITQKGSKRGDVQLTKYGIEGTPVYHIGIPGEAFIDFVPNRSESEIAMLIDKFKSTENISPIRKIKRLSFLSKSIQPLFFHLLKQNEVTTSSDLSKYLKKFPLTLNYSRPLEEAISSSGGISFEDLNNKYQWKNNPRVFFAGEMLNWDAPTGGFLIQMCVSQGFYAARSIYETLSNGFLN